MATNVLQDIDMRPDENSLLNSPKSAQHLEDSRLSKDETNDIRKELDYEERLNILELMWEIVLVDEVLDVFEAQLMRRVSGLLYISDKDSGNCKKRAFQKLNNN